MCDGEECTATVRQVKPLGNGYRVPSGATVHGGHKRAS